MICKGQARRIGGTETHLILQVRNCPDVLTSMTVDDNTTCSGTYNASTKSAVIQLPHANFVEFAGKLTGGAWVDIQLTVNDATKAVQEFCYDGTCVPATSSLAPAREVVGPDSRVQSSNTSTDPTDSSKTGTEE